MSSPLLTGVFFWTSLTGLISGRLLHFGDIALVISTFLAIVALDVAMMWPWQGKNGVSLSGLFVTVATACLVMTLLFVLAVT